MLPVLAAAAAGYLFLRGKRRNPGRRRVKRNPSNTAVAWAKRLEKAHAHAGRALRGRHLLSGGKNTAYSERMAKYWALVKRAEAIPGMREALRQHYTTQQRNPAGCTAPDGWRYNLKDNREWNEFQIIARTPKGNLHEGRKQFYPYQSYNRESKREARAEAEKALAQLIATGSLINPRRRRKHRRK